MTKNRQMQLNISFFPLDDQNEEAIMKMKAKINFYTARVGRHKNILEFIGSVEDEVRKCESMRIKTSSNTLKMRYTK